MRSDDVVDPADAAVQALLNLAADSTNDPEKRDELIDAILTIPPLAQWPAVARDNLLATCQFIAELGDDLRLRNGDSRSLTRRLL